LFEIKSMSTSAKTAVIVELDYNDLINDEVNLNEEISTAFGVDGVGVLTVKNVPNYMTCREKLLPLSRQFATLRDEVKEKYVHKDSFYSFGWSHGKEKLQGKPDTSKGSFYANPQYNRPVDDEDLIAKYPAFIHPNIWPTDDLPELEHAFKDLGQLIVSVGKLVAKHCDKFVLSNCPSYKPHHLEEIVDTSKCCKARLLHYFPFAEDSTSTEANSELLTPQEESKHEFFSSWCGWHNDHGSLTGLTAAMFMDENGNIVENTDKDAGLYVLNRKSETIKVAIPVGNIAFQIGETAQIHSGGCLQATPHAVRGSKAKGISRETFAVFMEPMWDEPMVGPPGADPACTQSQSAAKNLPPGVPPLSARWRHNSSGDSESKNSKAQRSNGNTSPSSSSSATVTVATQDFGQFTTETLNFYY
jgi:isopenicillin N synthase-like dioxygenase